MSTTERVVLGVDPGTNVLGYAFIKATASKPILLEMGTINMSHLEDHALKLKHIFEGLQRLISLHLPQEFAIEAPFYGKDAQAMLKLGRAQGVAIAAAILRGLPMNEYSPRSVKKSITGNGNASKEQVQAMLPHLIEGELSVASLDASDALAIAVTHLFQQGRAEGAVAGKTNYKGWEGFVQANPHRQAKPK